MKNTAELIVRSYECDSYGHVNNAVYVNYLEYGRMQFLHAVNFDYDGLVKAGYYLYVTHINIYYKASAFLDDKLFIEAESIELKHVSGTFHQKITKADGTVCVEADVTWASVNKDGKLSKIPSEFIVEGLKPEVVQCG